MQIQTVHGERVPLRHDDDHARGLPARSRRTRRSRCSRTGAPSTSPPAFRWARRLASPDNLAIDHDGNIYIVEDRSGGVDDDIWFAKDLNKDGDLNDPGEGIGRWASNGTVGSEFTGLYFDPTDKRRAWVNIQHPDSGNDRTIEITIPRSATITMATVVDDNNDRWWSDAFLHCGGPRRPAAGGQWAAGPALE